MVVHRFMISAEEVLYGDLLKFVESAVPASWTVYVFVNDPDAEK